MTFRSITLGTVFCVGIATSAMAVPTSTTDVYYYFTVGVSESGSAAPDSATSCSPTGAGCSTDADCCGSNHCIGGTCGTCPSGTIFVNGSCKNRNPSCSGGSYNSDQGWCETDAVCPSNPQNLERNGDECVKEITKTTRLECVSQTLSSLCSGTSDSCCYITITCPDGSGGQTINASTHTCCNRSGSGTWTVSQLMEWQTFYDHGADKPSIGIQCTETGKCEVWFLNRWCASGCVASPGYWRRTKSFELTTGEEKCPFGWEDSGNGKCSYSTSLHCPKGDLVGDKCVWDPE